MVIVDREIKNLIKKSLFKKKIIILYGARQVGKTTLVKSILKEYPQKQSVYFNCDEPDIRDAFTSKTSTELKELIGANKLVILDEAQRVKNIGLTLKLIIDNYPDIQIIATGSSSFELSNKIAEPLTGRKLEFLLFPISISELGQRDSGIEINRLLEQRLIFGMYPDVLFGESNKTITLKTLTASYLFKDIFQFQNIRNPEILEKLLQALALQLGNEVSYNELANIVDIDKNTVASYIQLLEKAFIVFRVRPYHRNKRKELTKLRKIYFYDNGVRNALINNLNSINLRQDVGALWENFIISERLKYNNNNNFYRNLYFWRTVQKEEVDLIEEEAGNISAYEIKFKKDKVRIPKAFRDLYPETSVEVINSQNFKKYL